MKHDKLKTVVLSDRGVQRRYHVHRLVREAFGDATPANSPHDRSPAAVATAQAAMSEPATDRQTAGPGGDVIAPGIYDGSGGNRTYPVQLHGLPSPRGPVQIGSVS